MSTHLASLRRELGLIEAASIVIGTIIGTGIFLKTATMTQLTGSAWGVLAAWLVAGLMSLMGALVYAELGELFPRAGGEYVYVRSAYGNWLAFLYGWQRFWIGSPGSIAAYAVGSATFLSGLIPMSTSARSASAVGFIIIFSTLNCLAVKIGGKAQAFLTALKMLLIFGLTAAIFCFSKSGTWMHLGTSSGQNVNLSMFGMAVLAALWAFDGWNNLPMAAGEVKDSERNVPRALIYGVIAVFFIYAIINVAYFYALPLEEILNANSKAHREALPVATIAAQTVFGQGGIAFLAIAMLISALGAMNGSILTGSRVPYAMAVDGIFPKRLALLSQGGAVPVRAVLVQGLWACVLALSGTFDQLTDWVVFSSWIFYALCGFSVLIFRRTLPTVTRKYKVPFYPVLPILFCVLSVLLLVNTLIESPRASLFGLAFILAGLPMYFWQKRNSSHYSSNIT
jgi:basic amino acid/polyamine antiporter, APA family